MPPVAVWETMNAYQPVFQTDGEFIGTVRVIGIPKLRIVKQVSQVGRYLPFIYANVFICFAKLTSPCPNITIHTFMHSPEEIFCKHGIGFKRTA
jgi:hypothetical protein